MTKVKVVGTFHVPSTWNPGKWLTANGTAERACTFCRLCRPTIIYEASNRLEQESERHYRYHDPQEDLDASRDTFS